MRTITIFTIISIFLFLNDITAQAFWETSELSEARYELAAAHVGDKVVFAGGFKKETFCQSKAVDIYDLTTGQWTVDSMGGRREEMKVAVAGNKAIFIGFSGATDIWREFDIYDAETNTITSMDSPTGMPFYNATGAGDKAYLISNAGMSIYDSSTDSWDLKEIPEFEDHSIGRSSAFYEGKIYYAGVYREYERRPDVSIYDTATDTWTLDSISVGRSSMQVLAFDGKVYFIAGILSSYEETDIIDIYDIASDTWSVETLPTPRFAFSAEVFDDKLYIAGGTGSNNNPTHEVIEIYDPATGTWESIYMQVERSYFDMAVAGKQLWIAGARDEASTLVEIYNLEPSNTKENTTESSISLSPNPCIDQFQVEWKAEKSTHVNIQVLDMNGRLYLSEYYANVNGSSTFILNAKHLPAGTYILRFTSNDQIENQSFIKL